MNLLLLGASGLVGSHLLQQALADARIERVTAPTRRALPAQPTLAAPVIDFDRLPPDAAWWRTDAVLCALGTTIAKAGSREAFRRVDHPSRSRPRSGRARPARRRSCCVRRWVPTPRRASSTTG